MMGRSPVGVATFPRNSPDVLLVEDDLAVREVMQDLLEEEGYLVLVARNGREALERLHETAAPRLILADLMMPEMDGSELSVELARDPRLSRVPLVLISADIALEQRAKGLSVAAVLHKPVTLERLLDTVRRLWNRSPDGACPGDRPSGSRWRSGTGSGADGLGHPTPRPRHEAQEQ